MMSNGLKSVCGVQDTVTGGTKGLDVAHMRSYADSSLVNRSKTRDVEMSKK